MHKRSFAYTVLLLTLFSLLISATQAQTSTASHSLYLPIVAAGGKAAPPPVGGSLPAELVGTWFNGSLLNLQFYDRNTGIWSDAGGLGHMYVFSANGSYTLVSFLKLGAGTTCESTVSKYQTGNARVAGDQLLLTPNSARTRTQVCAASATETEGPYDTIAIPWRIGEDDLRHTKLWLTEVQGETAYYKDGLGPQLLGSWYNGDAAAIELYDQATGHWAEPTGANSEWYAISANGTYRHGEINAGYGSDPCRLVTMIYTAGTISGRGSEFSLQPTGALQHVVSLCDPSDVLDEPYDSGGTERWGWSFSQHSDGLALDLLRLDLFRSRTFFPVE